MTGELAALSGALCWALASIFFADIGLRVRAVNLNMIKGLLASLMMVCTLAVGTMTGAETISWQSFTEIGQTKFSQLMLSGTIGIGIGDSVYFACLRRIGPQKGLMLESTAPVMAALLALLLFHEYLPGNGWLGIGLTCTGVILVVRWSRTQKDYTNSAAGVILGLLAAAAQATGIVLSRMALAGNQIEPLASSLVRLVSGLLFMGCYIAVMHVLAKPATAKQSLADAVYSIRHHHLFGKLMIAVFIGTFVALWLQQIAVKHTGAGVVQTLLATCPLFGMLYGVIRGQKQSLPVWLGLFLGISGISLLFLY